MSEQVSLREFFETRFDALDAKAERIITLQGETNGRVRKAEVAIAILQWAYAVGLAVIGWLVIR